MRKSWKEMNAEQKVEFVKKNVLDGKSAREVSEMLTGATRNAIIGFCHRNNLPLGKASVSRFKSGEPRQKRTTKPKPKTEKLDNQDEKKVDRRSCNRPVIKKEKPPVDKPEPVVEVRSHVNFMQLTNDTCRWPLQHSYKGKDPTEMLFCGCSTDREIFCLEHRKIAYAVL